MSSKQPLVCSEYLPIQPLGSLIFNRRLGTNRQDGFLVYPIPADNNFLQFICLRQSMCSLVFTILLLCRPLKKSLQSLGCSDSKEQVGTRYINKSNHVFNINH